MFLVVVVLDGIVLGNTCSRVGGVDEELEYGVVESCAGCYDDIRRFLFSWGGEDCFGREVDSN